MISWKKEWTELKKWMNNKLYLVTPLIMTGGFVERLWFLMPTPNKYCWFLNDWK